MIAEFDIKILPGLATLLIMGVVLIVVIGAPLRSEREIKERAERKKHKKARSTDVLNVDSKGGN